MTPAVGGILETALYVENVERSARFYHELFGFDVMIQSERIAALAVAGRDVLLLFARGATTEPIPLQDGFIPPHDGSGSIHLAFSIEASSLEAWKTRLAEQGVAVESSHTWERGGTSLYFRDPDGHLVELAQDGVEQEV